MTVWGLVVRQEGNDWDARKRRARKDVDDDSILSEEEEDRLAGLIQLDEDDNEDAELTEQAKQQLRNATALKGAEVAFCASSMILYGHGSSACCGSLAAALYAWAPSCLAGLNRHVSLIRPLLVLQTLSIHL